MIFSNKFKNNTSLSIMVLVVLAIIVALNVLSSKIFWHFDLTQNKIYSTSNITKSTLKDLPEVINVRIYFSKNLPSQYAILKQQLNDTLSNYHSYGSKFHYQFIDPADGKEAESLGIPKLQFNDIKQDKLEVVSGYLGLAINYQDKQEIIPVIQDIESLEYQLVSAIKKMTAESQPVIGIVKGHDSLSINQDLKILNSELSKVYQVKEIDLSKGVADDIKTLLVIGLKENLSDAELKNLDKFLVTNHSLIVLHDGVNVITSPINLNTENNNNLINFLSKYGIIIHQELIADVNSGIANFNQGIISFSVNYPVWPKILKSNFEQTNPTVSHLDSIILPWASNLTIDQSKISTGSVVSELAKTSGQAWSIKASQLVNPTQKIIPSSKTKQYIMSASINGDINSLYGQGQGKQSRLMVVGDSDFVKDSFIRGNPNNLIFIQNLIDSATMDSGLATIRSKNIIARPIRETTTEEKLLFKFINIFGIAILVVASGVFRYYWRKKTKTLEL